MTSNSSGGIPLVNGKCFHCSTRVPLEQYEKHLIHCEAERPNRCTLLNCAKRFKTLTALKIHQGKYHTGKERNAQFPCTHEGCEFGTDNEQLLQRHLDRHVRGFRSRSRSRGPSVCRFSAEHENNAGQSQAVAQTQPLATGTTQKQTSSGERRRSSRSRSRHPSTIPQQQNIPRGNIRQQRCAIPMSRRKGKQRESASGIGVFAKRPLVERLKKEVVLVAEGYLFNLEQRGLLKAGAFVPEVVLDNPEALRQLHKEFLNCGSDVVVACTYNANREKLRIIGRESEVEAMNLQALKIAREVANEGNALLAGGICKTSCYNPHFEEASGTIVRRQYEEQLGWMDKVGGVDYVVAESMEYVGEAQIALEAIKKHGYPAVITFAATHERSQDGFEWTEACTILEANGADVVGFNCSRGPATMLPLLRLLRKSVKCPIAALPVSFATSPKHKAFQFLKDREGYCAFPASLEQHLLGRYEVGQFAAAAKNIGVNYIGLCCGAAPYHVRSMAQALGRIVPASRYSADLASRYGAL